MSKKQLKAKHLQKNKKYQVQERQDNRVDSGEAIIEIITVVSSHVLFRRNPNSMMDGCSKEEFDERFKILKELD